MSRGYTKVETLSEETFRRKVLGETNREIEAHFGLSKEQIKGSIKCQNCKQRLIATGYVPRPKGRHAKIRQLKNKKGTTNWPRCGCRWSFYKIFRPKLGEGEAEIPCDRTV